MDVLCEIFLSFQPFHSLFTGIKIKFSIAFLKQCICYNVCNCRNYESDSELHVYVMLFNSLVGVGTVNIPCLLYRLNSLCSGSEKLQMIDTKG